MDPSISCVSNKWIPNHWIPRHHQALHLLWNLLSQYVVIATILGGVKNLFVAANHNGNVVPPGSEGVCL